MTPTIDSAHLPPPPGRLARLIKKIWWLHSLFAPGATLWTSPIPPDVIRSWPPCEKKSRSPAAVSTPTMSPIDELALPGVRSAMRTVPPVVPSVR